MAKKSEKLSYEALKSVLRHMNANHRICIYRDIDSLRSVERVVPLHIQELRLGLQETVIDNMSYKLRLRECRCESPSSFDREVLTKPENEPLEHGDVNFKPEIDEIYDDESGDEEVENLDNEDLDEELGNPENDEVEDEDEDEENSENGLADERLEDSNEDDYEDKKNLDKWFADEKVVNSKQDVSKRTCSPTCPCSLMNIPDVAPPFGSYIELEISSTKRFVYHKIIHRFRNPMKLHEAMRNLNSQLFGGREGRIYVKKFSVHEGVVRLPSDFKIVASKVDASRVSISAMEKILQESSYPLAVFKTSEQWHLKHRVAKTANKLKFHIYLSDLQWLPTMLSLTNKHIHAEAFDEDVRIDRYISFVDHWLKNHPAVGTSFEFKLRDNAETLFTRLSEQLRVINKDERKLTIELNNVNVLVISYTEYIYPWFIRNHIHENSDVDWMMKFEICQKQPPNNV